MPLLAFERHPDESDCVIVVPELSKQFTVESFGSWFWNGLWHNCTKETKNGIIIRNFFNQKGRLKNVRADWRSSIVGFFLIVDATVWFNVENIFVILSIHTYPSTCYQNVLISTRNHSENKLIIIFYLCTRNHFIFLQRCSIEDLCNYYIVVFKAIFWIIYCLNFTNYIHEISPIASMLQ